MTNAITLDERFDATVTSDTAGSRTFRRDIEGLRGVAVSVVVAFHVGLPQFAGGFVGVDVFFVISGFLITQSLFDEWVRTQHVRLCSFWARRIRRLSPALMVVLLACLAATTFVYSPLAWPTMTRTAGASALYVSNAEFARSTTNYFATTSTRSPFLHTWSLAVEEQFYLFFPLVFVGLGWLPRRLRNNPRTLAICALSVVGLMSFVLSLTLSASGTPWAFFSSPTRAWEFAAGGLTGLAIAARPARSKMASPLGWAGLSMVVVAVLLFNDKTSYPGFSALLPVAATVLLLAFGGARGGPRAVLEQRQVRWLGKVSYTWYLWHWPIIIFTSVLFWQAGMLGRAAAAGVALVLAAATSRIVENPMRFSRGLISSRARTYVFGVAAVVTVLAACGLLRVLAAQSENDGVLKQMATARRDRPHLKLDGCPRVDESGEYCILGADEGKATVMVVGDSHAAQWVPALARAAREADIRLHVRTMGGCPAIDVVVASRVTLKASRECALYQAGTWRLIEKLRPAAVVASETPATGRLLSRDGGPLSAEEGKLEWTNAVRAFSDRLAQSSTGFGLILDTPWLPFDPVECGARNRSASDCSAPASFVLPALADRQQADIEGLRQSGRGTFLDPSSFLCDHEACPIVRDGVIMYSDDNHLTRTYSATLSPQVKPFLAGLVA